MIKPNPVLIRNEHEERVQVNRDLRLVIGLNVLLLAVLVGLYFLNRGTGHVETFFFNLLKF